MEKSNGRQKGVLVWGFFLNRGNEEFDSVVHSQIYVDKTDILNFFNKVINTEQRYVCVSRPGRFSKSVTANTIAAYYETAAIPEHYLREENCLIIKNICAGLSGQN